MITLSVVIPTCGRASLLGRCLEHLAAQSLDPRRFEVIVADDASADNTSEVCHQWITSSPWKLRYLRCDKSFAGGARNRGAELAEGRRILFLGDDILSSTDLLEQHLAAEDTWGGEAVFVGTVRYDPATATPFMRYLEEEGVHHDFPRLRLAGAEASVPGRYFYACNASIPATTFRALGGFDERLRRAWEDTEFGVRVERHGVSIRYLKKADALHVHPTTARDYLAFRRSGRDDIALAVRLLAEAGGTFPAVEPHPLLDRLVTDDVVDLAARVLSKIDHNLPKRVRARAYRRLLRYEERRAWQAAHHVAA